MTLISMQRSVDILILERDPEAAAALCELLPGEFTRRIVFSVEEAEVELDRRLPSLFLCADDLPTESGLMFLARTRGKWTHLRRILMVPDPDGEPFFSARRQVPLLSYLKKPLEKKSFNRIIRHALWESNPDTYEDDESFISGESHPLSQESAQKEIPHSDAPLTTSIEVVIIEADLGAAARLTSLLPWGFRYHIVSTVEAAEPLLDANPPDLILCADDLPTESGLMFLARTQHKWTSTKRALMVPDPGIEFFFLVRQSIPSLIYLGKPVEKNELLHVLQQVLHGCFPEEKTVRFLPVARILRLITQAFVLLLGASIVLGVFAMIYHQIQVRFGPNFFPN